MANVLVVTNDAAEGRRLRGILESEEHAATVVSYEGAAANDGRTPDLILFDFEGPTPYRESETLLKYLRSGKRVAAMALVTEVQLRQFANGVSDFVTKPCREGELVVRLRRLLGRQADREDEIIACGDLVINVSNYDITLAGGKLDLTFREYELLRFLASNPGRVLTREVILNEVWGYDYYGGDRTVDVHIRRLRCKIEDGGRAFIETVRNVGYRFRKPA